MKKLLLILLIVQCTILTVSAQWVQVSNGMGNLTANSLAANINTIFAGCSGSQGVYLSTNNGANWTQTSLNNQSVKSLLLNGNNIFAGTETSPSYGVYLSTNNGTSWTQTSLTDRRVAALAISGNNVFAGTYYGVYLSTNNGTTWTLTSLNYRTAEALAVNGNNIFAGDGAGYGVYLSTNNGTSWNQTSLNNRRVRSLAVNGNNIFAGNIMYGVYLSTDNGTNWTQTSINNQDVYSLAVNVNNVFAGTQNNGVYVSNDNGANWSQRNEGLGNFSIRALCVVNNYIFAGTGAGVYRRPLSELTGIQQISNEVSQGFSLAQNYPNPFNPVTKIRFDVPAGTRHGSLVRIVVYDILGREVATLVNEQLSPGRYEVDWDAANFQSGVYYYALKTEGYTEAKKMILLK